MQLTAEYIKASLKRGYSPLFLARRFRKTVGEIHKAAGCQNGDRCTGQGCRVNV